MCKGSESLRLYPQAKALALSAREISRSFVRKPTMPRAQFPRRSLPTMVANYHFVLIDTLPVQETSRGKYFNHGRALNSFSTLWNKSLYPICRVAGPGDSLVGYKDLFLLKKKSFYFKRNITTSHINRKLHHPSRKDRIAQLLIAPTRHRGQLVSSLCETDWTTWMR